MADLVAFLRARLDEDEQAAMAAGGRVWSVDDEGCCILEDGVILETTGRMDAYRDADVRHVAQWDPARVLAEVEAKRRIVDLHSGGLDSLGRPLTVHIDQDVPEQPACLGCNFDNDEEYRYAVDECPTKRLLALPYRDHPDYSDWAVNRSERGGDAMEVCPQCGSWIATAKKPQHSEWHVGVDS